MQNKNLKQGNVKLSLYVFLSFNLSLSFRQKTETGNGEQKTGNR